MKLLLFSSNPFGEWRDITFRSPDEVKMPLSLDFEKADLTFPSSCADMFILPRNCF